MSGGLEGLVTSGPLILAIPVAAAAGAITFLSPCCLPLVPGYLSYVTGMSGTDAQRGPAGRRGASRTADGDAGQGEARPGTASVGAAQAGATQTATAQTATATAGTATAGTAQPTASRAVAGPAQGLSSRGRTVAGTALFVLGFSALYVSYGVAFGEAGLVLREHQAVVTRVLGVVTIVLGLLFAGALDRFALTGRIIKPSVRPRAGLAGAPFLGVLFGLGWSPCIGPTLIAVLTLGEATGTAARGAFLAFVYCIGLGIPFLMVALAFQRGVSVFGFARRHARLITTIGGCMLVVVGVLEVTGAWTTAMSWLQTHWVANYNEPI